MVHLKDAFMEVSLERRIRTIIVESKHGVDFLVDESNRLEAMFFYKLDDLGFEDTGRESIGLEIAAVDVERRHGFDDKPVVSTDAIITPYMEGQWMVYRQLVEAIDELPFVTGAKP